MAEIVRYVNTASSPGGDGTTNATSGANRAYASLNEWEADEQQDLAGGGNTMLVHCEGSAADTAAVTINGWTTNATYGITIQADEDKRHPGEWSTGHYRVYPEDAIALFTYEDYINVIGVQFGNHTPTVNSKHIVCLLSVTASNQINIEYCIIKGAMDSTYSMRCVQIVDADFNVLIRNTLVYDAGTIANCYGIYGDNSTNVVLENVTVARCWICIRGASGTWTETNVLCDNSTIAGTDLYTWYNDANHTRTYCASNDDKADDQGGAGNRVNQTFTFVDGYHLASNDAGARDHGTDLSGQGYTDDIDGETRTGTWDIGADEYIAPVGIAMPIISEEGIHSTIFGGLVVR